MMPGSEEFGTARVGAEKARILDSVKGKIRTSLYKDTGAIFKLGKDGNFSTEVSLSATEDHNVPRQIMDRLAELHIDAASSLITRPEGDYVKIVIDTSQPDFLNKMAAVMAPQNERLSMHGVESAGQIGR